MKWFGLILTLTLLNNTAYAKVDDKYRNVIYDQSAFTIENFVLGRTCFSLAGSRDNMPCNPADLAEEKNRQLRFNIMADNKFNEAMKFSRELKSGNESGIINRLLDHNRPLTHQASAAIWYRQDWWAFSILPLQVNVIAATTNPAYPKVALHAVQNEEFAFRSGFFFADDLRLRVGGQFRFVKRHELRDEFALLDVISHTRKLEIEENSMVYFEPGFRYELDSDWHPSFSMVFTNLPLYEKKKSSDAPTFEIGYTTTPDFLDRRFKSSLHYTRRQDVASYKDRLLWGAQYSPSQYFTLLTSLGGQYYSFGLTARFDSVTTGIGYKAEEVPTPFHNQQTTKTLNLEFGLRF